MFLKLILLITLARTKEGYIKQYPQYKQQISQVKVPTLQHRKHMRFDWKHLQWIKGETNLFSNPQIWVTLGKNEYETIYIVKHEIQHFIIFAAGLPDKEHKKLDGK